MWQRYEALTNALSVELAEQLRLVLEPTLASKLMGDYRTGKRLNMKKIIPYIASDFRKDKIWLRRTKPSTRKYQVRFRFSQEMQTHKENVPLGQRS
jgi:midasin